MSPVAVLILVDMLVFMKGPSDIFDLGKLKDRIFGQWWLRMGPAFALRDEETVVPHLVSLASGIVIELGPGMGSQIPRYDKSKVTKIYGIEPTANLHDALRTKVRQCGLEGVYEIVPCGIEDVAGLRKHGISLASADTVMSMQVLCSVPEPEEMVRRLYALLKLGGQMIVYEHVRSKDWVSRFVQSEFPLPLLLHIWSCLMSRVRMLTEVRRCI